MNNGNPKARTYWEEVESHELCPNEAPIRLQSHFPPPPRIRWHRNIPELLTEADWKGPALAFAAGTIWARYLCNPATFRRRMAFVTAYTAFAGLDVYAGRSLALYWNALSHLQETSLPTPFASIDQLNASINDSNKHALVDWLLLWPGYVVNPLLCDALPPCASARLNHLKAIDKKATELKFSTNDLIAQYIAKEKEIDHKLSWSDRLAFKWRNIWSTAKTRAQINAILSTYPRKPGVTDVDVRRCTSLVAALLEYNESRFQFKHEITVWSVGRNALLAGLVFSRPLVVYPSAIVALCSAAFCVPAVCHLMQLLEEHTKYSSPAAGAKLHVLWLDFVTTTSPPKAE
ncbi:hypothetical protein NM688_g7316 [Phlebia brevispora]|uniref:Uncharacterized protein n=1 Tax=Phlebia brevispora TaxID=194682 RepID=A0ACC1S6K5_9APHY|nr:hypothetical protein NM688_g7316 [Phlebia brevispora]